MSMPYGPRKHAPGYLRRSFKGGVRREEIDPKTGKTRLVQVPKSYWESPEWAIPIQDLPEFWEHNNTQFTPAWRREFAERLQHDYLDIVCTYDYEFTGNPQDFKRLVDQTESFFDSVRKIEKWPFWAYTVQKSWRTEKSLLPDAFKKNCPDYNAYLEYKSAPASERDCLGWSEYSDWRRDCIYNSKHAPRLPDVRPGSEFRYRDEELQLGEVEMHSEPSAVSASEMRAFEAEFGAISIYQYLDGKALVPTPDSPDVMQIRMADVALIHDEIAEQTGLDVESDEFTRIIAEHAERQSDIVRAGQDGQDNKKAGKTRRERAIDDLNRLAVDIERAGSVNKERGDDSYGG